MTSKELTGTDNKVLLPLCRMQLSSDHEQKNYTQKSPSFHSRLHVSLASYEREKSISGCMRACIQQKNCRRRQKKTICASIHLSESAKRGQCISFSAQVSVICHRCPEAILTVSLASIHTYAALYDTCAHMHMWLSLTVCLSLGQ